MDPKLTEDEKFERVVKVVEQTIFYIRVPADQNTRI